jgi:hypothetical protein
METIAYNASFAHLTEEEIAADVKASAMEEGSDNELDEPQEPSIKKKLVNSTRGSNQLCGLFNKLRIAGM